MASEMATLGRSNKQIHRGDKHEEAARKKEEEQERETIRGREEETERRQAETEIRIHAETGIRRLRQLARYVQTKEDREEKRKHRDT